jgi:hypothetical protein
LERLATTAAGFFEVFDVFDVFELAEPGRAPVVDAARKPELDDVRDVPFALDFAPAVLVADVLCDAD